MATPTPTASSTSTIPSITSSNKHKNENKLPTATAGKLSTDPQSVAARERRHRISNRFKILQSLVPGGSKMDTVSMLEQTINYVKFLKAQILIHQTLIDMDNTTPDYQYRNQVRYNQHQLAAAFYFTPRPTLDSGSPDLRGSATSYCTHSDACSRQPAGGSQQLI